MQLEVMLERSEIEQLLHEFAPIRIHMTPTDEDRRWVQLDELKHVELVPGRGVRVESNGRVCYAIGGVKPKLEIRTIHALLEPKIVQSDSSGGTLAFSIDIEDSDLKMVPAVVDAAIMRKVNESLTPENTGMRWVFSTALSKKFDLPSRLEPLDQLEMAVSYGQVLIDEEALRFRVQLEMRLTRFKPVPTDDDVS